VLRIINRIMFTREEEEEDGRTAVGGDNRVGFLFQGGKE